MEQDGMMNAVATEKRFRAELSVPQDASIGEIFALIQEEGFSFRLIEDDRLEPRRWACPVIRGIFGTCDLDNKSGELGQVGWPSPTLAALEGLRKARLLPRIDVVEYTISWP